MPFYRCPTCQSGGFDKSKMINRCEFCDGSFGGNPPTEQEIKDHNMSTPNPLLKIPGREVDNL